MTELNMYRIGSEGTIYAYIWAERFTYTGYEHSDVYFWIGAVVVGQCSTAHFTPEE